MQAVLIVTLSVEQTKMIFPAEATADLSRYPGFLCFKSTSPVHYPKRWLSAYQRIEAQAAVEASAISDLYNDAARYDRAALAPLRQEVRTYLETVLSDEWAKLGAGHGLSDAAWSFWDRVYETVLNLEPDNRRQESLRANMLDRIHAIAQSREIRASEAARR